MKNMKCAYPFLEDDNWYTDFEVMTDGLASKIGYAYSLASEKYKDDLEILATITWDLNPMIRKENKQICIEHHDKLVDLYKKYSKKFDEFYLPISNDTFASYMSTLRLDCKQIVRLLVKNKSQNRKLLDSFHIMCNLFHFIFLDSTNKKIPFTSRTWKIKKQ